MEASVLDNNWTFPLTKESFIYTKDLNGDCLLSSKLKSFFHKNFVPDQKTEFVYIKFENEDGSVWGLGGDYRAEFNEFFSWSWSYNGVEKPTMFHRPAWLTIRTWQKMIGNIRKVKFNYINWLNHSNDECYKILEERYKYITQGIFDEYGFPSRVVLTLG